MKTYLIVLVLVTALSGCGNNTAEPLPIDNGKDREEILTHWADEIIIPSYEGFNTVLDVMVQKAEAFNISPDVNTLEDLRGAWVEAYLEWQKVEMFEFGPADQITLRNFFNIYPADVSGITANINDPAANLGVPASYARQGFPALDYLLNGLGSDEETVSFYTDDESGEMRLAYLAKIVQRMNTLSDGVLSSWKESYRDTFIANTSTDIGSPFGKVVNAFVLHYERYIRSGKFGIPSGAMTSDGETPLPDRLEAFYKKDISLSLALNAHQATIDFFNGTSKQNQQEGPSFKSYLNSLEAKDQTTGELLSDIINDQFAIVTADLNELMPGFEEQIAADNSKMIDVYLSMQRAVRMLKVDMTSAMSITITYTDNDGD